MIEIVRKHFEIFTPTTCRHMTLPQRRIFVITLHMNFDKSDSDGRAKITNNFDKSEALRLVANDK